MVMKGVISTNSVKSSKQSTSKYFMFIRNLLLKNALEFVHFTNLMNLVCPETFEVIS